MPSLFLVLWCICTYGSKLFLTCCLHLRVTVVTAKETGVKKLRAFSVHEPWAVLIVLRLGHPHLLERPQARQN